MSYTDKIQTPTGFHLIRNDALARFSVHSFGSKFVFSLYENGHTTLPLRELATRVGLIPTQAATY
jgi:hypothetical protein